MFLVIAFGLCQQLLSIVSIILQTSRPPVFGVLQRPVLFPLFGPPLPLVLQNVGSMGFPMLSSFGSHLFPTGFLIFFLLGTNLFPMLLPASFPDL